MTREARGADDGWVRVAPIDAIVADAGRTVVAGGRPIALFRCDGAIWAIDDTCPHQGASLGEGAFFDGRVICPRHAWVFDVRTGRCPRETHEPVAAHAARCKDGMVEVRLAEDP